LVPIIGPGAFWHGCSRRGPWALLPGSHRPFPSNSTPLAQDRDTLKKSLQPLPLLAPSGLPGLPGYAVWLPPRQQPRAIKKRGHAMYRIGLCAGAFLCTFGLFAAAQETPPPPIAKHVEPTYKEIASPMQIEVSLGATPKRKSVQEIQNQHAWVATETGAYTCETARVRMIEVFKEEHSGKVRLKVMPMLATEQRRQDIDLTVSLVSDDKEIVAPIVFKSLTIGADNSTANKLAATLSPVYAAFGSTSKAPVAEFELTREQFAALWGENRAPSVRVVVKIDE
jgi:hypothetical protein